MTSSATESNHYRTLSSRKKMELVRQRLQPRLQTRNYNFTNVGWDDCARAFGSSIGPNISDWTYTLKDGTILPFIRGPNYQDKTLTIPAKNLAIVVGNEKFGGDLQAINFQKYLNNYGKYTPGVPNDLDLSKGQDELCTIRFIGVLVPTDNQGKQEVVPTAYNYQTTSRSDPKNFIGASFHMGVGSRTDGPNTEKVFLVKTDADGNYENTWFRITDEVRETDEQKKAVATVLGTQSTGLGRNRVQCFQIPRKQEKKVTFRSSGNKMLGWAIGYKGYDLSMVGSPMKCGKPLATCSWRRGMGSFLNVGNVSYGSSGGKHSMEKLDKYERDKGQNITITFAYYWVLPEDGEFSEEAIDAVMDTLDKSYLDMKGEWLGSLVTGEQDETSIPKKEPPIKLSELSYEDCLVYNQKVTNFPKTLESVQNFPEETVY